VVGARVVGATVKVADETVVGVPAGWAAVVEVPAADEHPARPIAKTTTNERTPATPRCMLASFCPWHVND
jgi:hypothetical protein